MLEYGVKGPQWLELQGVQPSAKNISTCQHEFLFSELTDNVHIVSEDSLPSLRVLSLSFATFIPPKSIQSQVYAAAAMVYEGVSVDQATDTNHQRPVTYRCVCVEVYSYV